MLLHLPANIVLTWVAGGGSWAQRKRGCTFPKLDKSAICDSFVSILNHAEEMRILCTCKEEPYLSFTQIL